MKSDIFGKVNFDDDNQSSGNTGNKADVPF